jgi:phosphoenolpyruvate synthase/pyruvate phosphate dikinase
VQNYVLELRSLTAKDAANVGSKNASLGEMIAYLSHLGVNVPFGFATTMFAFTQFMQHNDLFEQIQASLHDVHDVEALSAISRDIKEWILAAPFADDFVQAIEQVCNQLPTSVAVRASVLAADDTHALFAGQQQAYLNVSNSKEVLHAIKHVFSAPFSEKALIHRLQHNLSHTELGVSATIQHMVRSDLAASGIVFSSDLESGFADVIFITASYGLGQIIVHGGVKPDEFYVHKPTLLHGRPAIISRNRGSKVIKMVYANPGNTKTVEVAEADSLQFSINDADVENLARQALMIERHYQQPMSIEWSKDGNDGQIYILQVRPEILKSQSYGAKLERFNLLEPGEILTVGRSVGQKIVTGTARIIHHSKEMSLVQKGDILVAEHTDARWEGVMKRAAAVVINRGGRTCFNGATKIITQFGFMSLADVYTYSKGKLYTPALNRKTLSIQWRPIIDTMRRQANTIKIAVLNDNNDNNVEDSLILTPDHKMLSLQNGKLVDVSIQELLDSGQDILLVTHIPQINESENLSKFYPGKVSKIADLSMDWVYNITVAEHHNYIVFSSNHSPILVNNCHAAILARELDIPAVVGCQDATYTLPNNELITVSCAEGDTGYVYKGELKYEVICSDNREMPKLPVNIMLNIGNPERAFDFARIPNHGVGLARLEFIINRTIGIHPKVLLEFDKQPLELKYKINKIISGYQDPVHFYVEKLTEGIATLAAAFYPKPVFVRFSDFKSNEYAHLLGGRAYEPEEENPLIGFRGVARYIDPLFREAFALECQAIRKVRDDMGFTNIEILLPFVRTVAGAKRIIELLASNGLERGKNQLKILMMCEVPANAILAKDFLAYFDGFSIGSNDLTQLVLGVDNNASLVSYVFDERDAAVKKILSEVIKVCKEENKYIGVCGQGASDHLDFALWLLQQGVDSISLNSDALISTWFYLAENSNR